jgi:hypothetical protein
MAGKMTLIPPKKSNSCKWLESAKGTKTFAGRDALPNR